MYPASVQGGSSPRVWGALVKRVTVAPSSRLIPTCVGSTGGHTIVWTTLPAHPHVCGEHLTQQRPPYSPPGSSPRVWGALEHHGLSYMVQRLIPTCVGSTSGHTRTRYTDTAHPHVCGEHVRVLSRVFVKNGSSPRVWGALNPDRALIRGPRLIPTCVGSTLADMGFYPHTPSFRISLEPKASINPTRFLGLSPSGSAPIPASFAPPFSWP